MESKTESTLLLLLIVSIFVLFVWAMQSRACLPAFDTTQETKIYLNICQTADGYNLIARDEQGNIIRCRLCTYPASFFHTYNGVHYCYCERHRPVTLLMNE